MQLDSDNTEIIRRLLEQYIPEIASGAVVIRGLAREPGKRSMVAVESKVPAVDAVGACTGARGSRVRAILAKLPGEHMDIVMWGGSLELFLGNCLAPNRAIQVKLDHSTGRAMITVPADSTPVSDLRLRLASRLVGWDLKMVTLNA